MKEFIAAMIVWHLLLAGIAMVASTRDMVFPLAIALWGLWLIL